MSRTTLKDARYHILGYIDTRSDGTLVGMNARYQIVGYYLPRQDMTQTAQYRIFGTGNLLASLITASAH